MSNILARRALALTMRAYWAAFLGPSATYLGLSMASALNLAALGVLRRRSAKERPVSEMILDSQSRYVLKRFLLKLVFLSIAALLQMQAPWGFRIAITTLAIASALLSACLAVSWRERPVAETLNYWDEAAAFLAIGIVAQWLP